MDGLIKMKHLVKKLALGCCFFCSAGMAFQASAAIILSTPCSESHVTAGGNNADACEGLFDKDKGPAPVASEGLLNTTFILGDSTEVWGAEGAFGHNDWVMLGKDDQGGEQNFINGFSGDPGLWIVDSALSGAFVISVKQSTEMGLWYFENLQDVTSGTFDVNAIFDSGITDDGWSHISIFSSASAVPEPGTIILMLFGMAGLLFVRRRQI